ncbi:hypothetical protein FYK55_02855 [Roseiconus nitratireducens]|uniref:Uncharacterized protein n=1 Tax=Roseiconus nitratireducens TaxID=2605748 RepID=A0A5M6DEQ9_9BACT|nr:hypothetical protein [Roseiconus nitratireducens]KAA5545873.1 hypothetical protein FYK55_02855 [Roseiconus nitratireducens]
MKYEIKLSTIERQLPKHFDLPATFHAFVQACQQSQRGDLGWFAIKHTKPKDLLGFEPEGHMVPVLRLPDGGFVSFWFGTKRNPSVVWCSSEGETKVVATTWSDFLSRMSKKRTGVPDLDDREVAVLPAIRGMRGNVMPLAKERREFKKWLNSKQPKQPTAGTDDVSEGIRRELVELMDRHFDKEDEDLVDIIDLQVTLTSRSYEVLWYGGHKKYPAPKRLRRTLDKLVDYLGRSLKKSEVSVWSDGRVFVEKNLRLGDKRP